METKNDVTKKKDVAKNLTLIILGVIALVGIVGSWFESFDMNKFTSFLDSYKLIYLGLILSIGGNSAVQKYKETK